MLSKIFHRGSMSLALVAVIVTPAAAQYKRQQDPIRAIGDLIGAAVQAGAKSKAERAWIKASQPLRSCVNTAFSSKNVAIEQLAEAGIPPSDQRIAPIIAFCDEINKTELQTNFVCNVTNSKGLQVSSFCNQEFAKDEGGLITEITRDEFIQRAGDGGKVQIAIVETAEAKRGRLAEEQRVVNAERQRYLNSREGMRAAAQKRIEDANIAKRWPFMAEFQCRSRRDGAETDITACLQYGSRYTNIVINNGENIKRYGTKEGNYVYLDSKKYTLNLGRKFSINAESANKNMYIFVEIKDRSGRVLRNMSFL